MRKSQLNRGALQMVIVTVLGAGLAGCGGGGGDSPPPPPVTDSISLSAANRDIVAHATAGGMLGMSPVETLPLTATASAADLQRAQAAGQPRPAAWLGRVLSALLEPVRAKARSARFHEMRPLAVSSSGDQPCAVSGTVSVSIDDVDNSGDLTPGDVMTMALKNCKDSEFETLSGTATTVFTQVAQDSFSARMTMTQLSDAAERHAMTINGAMLFAYSQAANGVEVTRMTADGRVVVSMTTHLPYSDTVTLSSGFVEEVTYDASFPPPPGTTQAGRATSTIQGTLHSAAAGGTVEVASQSPVTKYDAEAYPRAGTVLVTGKTGTLLMTAQSADSVQLSLDANDDGKAESTEAVGWDWLF